MNDITNIDQLIIRYLDGNITDSEKEHLNNWLLRSQSNKAKFYTIKDTWDSSLQIEDKSYSSLFKFYKNLAFRNSKTSKSLSLWKTISGFAAAVSIILVTLFTINTIHHPFSPSRSTSSLVSFKVPFGSRSEVTLPDGSNVVLNSGSELSYPSLFSKKKREVTLIGEAYFHVNADTNNPFIVHTTDFDVQVTGTRFNICSYSDNSFSSVTLAQGTLGVNFPTKQKLVHISPGEKLSHNRSTRNYQIDQADISIEAAWKEDKFRFKGIRFPDLIKRLERWYNVRLIYNASELEEMVYSGNFKNQETIWQVLDALKLTTPIDYNKKGFREFEIIYKPK